MLKVIGNVYGNDKEAMAELTRVLTNSGYTIAYQNDTSGVVIKEVNDESGN